MSKALKIVSIVLVAFVSITILHVWLNIGFDRLGLRGGENAVSSFRVGFLPVT